jgi:hypothetical protein
MRAPRSVVLEQNGDELTLTLQPVGFRKETERALLAFVMLFGITFLLPLGWGVRDLVLHRTTPNTLPLLLVVEFAVCELWLLSLVYYLLNKALWKPIFTATKEELCLSYRGFLLFRGWRWPRSSISGIGAWKGLWVVALGKPYRLLTERNADELLWVAAVLRKALRVPEGRPETRDEIPVTFEDSIFKDPMPGFLRSRPGELRVRHVFALFPVYRFRAAKGRYVFWLQKVRSGKSSLVWPVDLTCRIEEGDGSALQITPSGSSFRLTAWCDEAEALPKAVARFWIGSEE